ncbi:MAG: hypothetical protein AB1705_27085 [Verrucomicrobiota bacterium]
MTASEQKQLVEQELRQVVQRLEEQARTRLGYQQRNDDWSQTQFFYAVKRTCKELKEDGFPAAEQPDEDATARLALENVVERLESSRAETHHQLEVLEVIRDELWKLLVENRREMDEMRGKLRAARKALRFYAADESWFPDPRFNHILADGGALAVKTLEELGEPEKNDE